MEMFLKTEKSLNILEKLRGFLFSNYWLAFLFVLAGSFTLTGDFFPKKSIEVAGTIVFALIVCVCFFVSDDIMAVIPPALFLSMVAIKCYDSYGVFIKQMWIAVPVVLSVGFHFYANRHRARFNGFLTKPMIAVSVAILLGGLGFITLKEYFALTSIYHMLFLGFGMVYIYGMFTARVGITKRYDPVEFISKLMVIIGIFGSFMVFAFYLVNIKEFMEVKSPLFMQWRNNCSTMLMLAMPFAFHLTNKKPLMAPVGFMFYLAILMTDSRGGMIFGAVELLLCILMFAFYDKKRRLSYLIICLVGAVLALVLVTRLLPLISHTLNRLVSGVMGFLVGDPNEIRTLHYARGINDFLNNPIFGTGLGYMGNRDVFESKAFALCWYHCEPIQIAASFGLVGIAAYLYQFVKRNLLLWEKTSLFNITVFISYIGLEMMSLVNPGVFCPMPYVLLITLFFVIVEKKNNEQTIDKSDGN